MKWTVPILMFLILTMSFSKGIVWLEYQVNKDFISKNLCINKLKPLLHCKGNCQLMKKLADQEEDKSSVPVAKLKAGFDETALPINNDFNLIVLAVTKDHPGHLKQSSHNSPVFPVFHPPA